MNIETTPIDGVKIIRPITHVDVWGEFQELYNKNSFDEYSIPFNVAQISRSRSIRHVFRGLHLQVGMDKIMRVTRGAAFTYNVDMRPDSPTFCKSVRIWAEEGDNQLIYAPWWVARGFVAMEPNTEIEYFQSATFDPKTSYTIQYNDSHFKFKLPVRDPILSDKDKKGLSVEEWIDVFNKQEWTVLTSVKN